MTGKGRLQLLAVLLLLAACGHGVAAEEKAGADVGLLLAAGDCDGLQALAGNGLLQKWRGPEGESPLLLAVINGSTDCLGMLLKAGIDVNLADRHGRTALGAAAHIGDAGVCELLLKAGADVNAASKSVPPPLVVAAFRGWQPVVVLLLKYKAEVNARNSAGLTALMGAASGGRGEMAQALLDGGATVDMVAANGATALSIAAMFGQRQMAKLLLEKGADPDQGAALVRAVSGGDLEIVRALLAVGSDPDRADPVEGMPPLVAAALRQKADMVQLLLHTAKTDLRAKSGMSALDAAAFMGDLTIVKLLVETGKVKPGVVVEGPDSPFVGMTPAQIARRKNFGEVAEWLERQGDTAVHPTIPFIDKAVSGMRIRLRPGMKIETRGNDNSGTLQAVDPWGLIAVQWLHNEEAEDTFNFDTMTDSWSDLLVSLGVKEKLRSDMASAITVAGHKARAYRLPVAEGDGEVCLIYWYCGQNQRIVTMTAGGGRGDLNAFMQQAMHHLDCHAQPVQPKAMGIPILTALDRYHLAQVEPSGATWMNDDETIAITTFAGIPNLVPEDGLDAFAATIGRGILQEAGVSGAKLDEIELFSIGGRQGLARLGSGVLDEKIQFLGLAIWTAPAAQMTYFALAMCDSREELQAALKVIGGCYFDEVEPTALVGRLLTMAAPLLAGADPAVAGRAVSTIGSLPVTAELAAGVVELAVQAGSREALSRLNTEEPEIRLVADLLLEHLGIAIAGGWLADDEIEPEVQTAAIEALEKGYSQLVPAVRLQAITALLNTETVAGHSAAAKLAAPPAGRDLDLQALSAVAFFSVTGDGETPVEVSPFCRMISREIAGFDDQIGAIAILVEAAGEAGDPAWTALFPPGVQAVVRQVCARSLPAWLERLATQWQNEPDAFAMYDYWGDDAAATKAHFALMKFSSALAADGSPEALTLLGQWLTHPMPFLRLDAVITLAQWGRPMNFDFAGHLASRPEDLWPLWQALPSERRELLPAVLRTPEAIGRSLLMSDVHDDYELTVREAVLVETQTLPATSEVSPGQNLQLWKFRLENDDKWLVAAVGPLVPAATFEPGGDHYPFWTELDPFDGKSPAAHLQGFLETIKAESGQ